MYPMPSFVCRIVERIFRPATPAVDYLPDHQGMLMG
jgi:hypothetical protein